jgi:1-acyl-sn-glycerol-3-phosphate acyltransferase
LAYWADGEIYVTGRAKDIIIKAGRNLYPHEVEEIAGRVQGVRTGCVVAFGANDARTGSERLVVTAEVRDMAGAKRIEEEISHAIADALGMPPDLVVLLPPQSIPKTSSGKLRRRETQRLFTEGELGRRQQPTWLQVAGLAARGSAPRVWTWTKQAGTGAFELLYGLYAMSIFTILLFPLWTLVAITRNRTHAAWLIHKGTRLMLRMAFVPVRVEGQEILDQRKTSGPWIFAPNHASYLDILINLAFLPPDVRFVAKGEIRDMLFFSTMARRSGQFSFNRSDPQARIRQAEQVNAALQNGESVAIYPEGTFTAVTGIRPFQLGAFKAAVDTQRPICPVSVSGARRILRDKTKLPRPGRITVTFGPLVIPDRAGGNDWQEIVRLRDTARELIAKNSGEPLL